MNRVMVHSLPFYTRISSILSSCLERHLFLALSHNDSFSGENILRVSLRAFKPYVAMGFIEHILITFICVDTNH